MSKKILLVPGHTSGHNRCKATGVNEGDLNIELVQLIQPILSKYAAVTVYPCERDMYHDVRDGRCQVNFRDYDYIFEVHFNAGGGRGTSIQIHSNYKGGISVEQTVIDRVAAFGFKKRGDNGSGIVRRSDLLNMNTALRKGVDYALIEVCFYDSAADLAIYQPNKSKIAQAIATGIADAFGLTGAASQPAAQPTPVPAPSQSYTEWAGRVHDVDPVGLIVRTGPGKGYGRLASYPKLYDGNMISVMGEQSGYYHVRISNPVAGTHIGWVSKDYVSRG